MPSSRPGIASAVFAKVGCPGRLMASVNTKFLNHPLTLIFLPRSVQILYIIDFHKLRYPGRKTKYWSDFDRPSATRTFKRAVAASEKGRMPFENEVEMLCLPA